MSLIKKAILPAIVAASVFAGAADAGTIVVRANGPSAKSYPPGKQLGDNGSVVLKAGDAVTILDGRGTRVLKGPGTFSTTAGTSTANGSALGQLLKNTGTRQARTGAVRSIGSAPAARSPNLWYVDVSRSGTFCLAEDATATFWRPSMEKEATLLITQTSNGNSAPLEFNIGQSTRSWPAALPLVLGSEYKITGGGQQMLVRFAALGPNPQGLEGTAAALIKNGCNTQLDLLVDTVAIPSSEAIPGG